MQCPKGGHRIRCHDGAYRCDEHGVTVAVNRPSADHGGDDDRFFYEHCLAIASLRLGCPDQG